MNNSYSITKDTTERFAWMFNRELGTKISVTRALNAYGPGQKEKPVRKIMPNFVLPALRGEEIMVNGDGSQIMDMVYVEDVADVLIKALLVEHGQYLYNPFEGENRAPKFDIGTGRRTTVQEIAEMVIKRVGKGTIKNVPMRQGEPENSVVVGDPETLKPLYEGKVPELVTLEEGIDRTVKYYEKVINES
jgi:nucleoside-diphosphate-sugar epimerase